MTQELAARISALTGFLGVSLGAFGAHGLSKILNEHGTLAIWQTGVLYHLIHAVALFILSSREPFRSWSWWCFLLGIVIFSGSLYVLAVTNMRWLGAITPFGGVAFLAGWLCLVIKPFTGKR